MGVCFSNPATRTIPPPQKLITQSYISRGMKLNSNNKHRHP